jgi:hypothetical protein
MGFANTEVFFNSISSGNVHRTDFQAKHDHATLTTSATLAVGCNLSSSNSFFGRCTFPTPSGNLAWTACSDTSGFGLPHGGNVSPSTKHIISAMTITPTSGSGISGTLVLVDLQGYWSNISLANTASQPLTGNPYPNLRYTNGEGCRLYTVALNASAATAQNIRVHYTNQANTNLRNSGLLAMTISSQIGQISTSRPNNNNSLFLPLIEADTGVANVANVQFSASSAGGLVALCLARPLIYVPLTTAASYITEREYFYQTPSLPQVKDGACLVWLYFATTNGAVTQHTNFNGAVEFAWG